MAGALNRRACLALLAAGTCLPLLAACSDGPEPSPQEVRAMYATPTVGGIESLVIDGRTWYYGFGYSDDYTLSPLIDDLDAMAAYASSNMRQRDGAHPATDWKRIARETEADSAITDGGGRIIDTAQLARAIAAAKDALERDAAAPEVELNSNLEYLFAATGDWPDADPPAEVQAAVRHLGLEVDDMSPWLDESASYLAGRQPLPQGASYRDAARLFLWTYQTYTDNLRFNWPGFFSIAALEARGAAATGKRDATH